jgi:hypothetical protein
MPPLNQSLWTLLIASLFAVAGWAVVHLSALVERERRERHARRFGEHAESAAPTRLPAWIRFVQSWLLP